MYCYHCGAKNSDIAKFCVTCGRDISGAEPESVTPQIQPPHASGTGPTGHEVSRVIPATSGKAIGSIICGFFGLFFPSAVAAVVLGHIARSDIRKSQGKLTGNGLALTGLTFGYFFACIIPFLIIAAIAIPNLLRSRIAANEAYSAGSLRTITTAELTYAAMYRDAGFTCSLEALGGEGGSPEHAGLIDTVLAKGQKSGYQYRITRCGNETPRKTFHVVAFPLQKGASGQRSICSDQSGIIKYAESGDPDDCLDNGIPF